MSGDRTRRSRTGIALTAAAVAIVSAAIVSVQALPSQGTPAAPRADDRLTGELAFQTLFPGGSGWFIAGDTREGQGFVEALWSPTEAGLPTGSTWTVPAEGATGVISPAEDPGRCLQMHDPAMILVACDGSDAQRYSWDTVPNGRGLRNADTRTFLGTASNGYDDSLQGSIGAFYAGAIDTARLSGGTPPTGGGIDPVGIGVPATVAPGEPVDVAFGMTTTAAVGVLHRSSVTVTAPAGLSFRPGTASLAGSVRSDAAAPWTVEPALTVSGSLSADGTTFQGTISDTGTQLRLPKGAELRWSAPLVAGATTPAGTVDMRFTISGTTD
ncbi:hypothetical protein [Curtobacterium sp. VKM Ac-2922]|uniref:hypothetical protein n=1 Tax=Curtobacterium sp. VKM Ac-2922 TaxID=2929475 RepID=UPI001FB4C874|nr:hypothetical protein [Curtobacterium sp. VKM Ac-2922]MCJ1712623.1 hypothetical protein [Curtobacterium sp. VKM Ac-2922]